MYGNHKGQPKSSDNCKEVREGRDGFGDGWGH